MISVGIVGGAGFTGGELIRLLLNHPQIQLKWIHSRSHAGHKIYSVHQDLLGSTDLAFVDQLDFEIDLVFLCLGHGESNVFLENNTIPEAVRIIDLSQDFRFDGSFNQRHFIYGLCELNYDKIKNAQNIANPGCFATAIQLGLLPLLKNGITLNNININGITGSTGAGQKLQSTTNHSWRNNNVSAYKSLTHQHIGEIKFNHNIAHDLPFIPWRGDFTRGIFITTTIETKLELKEISDLYQQYYEHCPFTHVAPFPIDVKQVVNTNNCFIQLEKVEQTLIIHSAIDNLLKGASGQAVQNMNIMYGFDEKNGLNLKATAF